MLTPETDEAATVLPGVSAREPPPTGAVPVIVPRFVAPLAPVRVTETALPAQPASMLVTVTPEILYAALAVSYATEYVPVGVPEAWQDATVALPALRVFAPTFSVAAKP